MNTNSVQQASLCLYTSLQAFVYLVKCHYYLFSFGILAMAFVSRGIYNTCFHNLHHVPGPFWGGFTDFYKVYIFACRHIPSGTMELHQQYGQNEISICIQEICWLEVKDRYYASPQTWCLLTIRGWFLRCIINVWIRPLSILPQLWERLRQCSGPWITMSMQERKDFLRPLSVTLALISATLGSEECDLLTSLWSFQWNTSESTRGWLTNALRNYKKFWGENSLIPRKCLISLSGPGEEIRLFQMKIETLLLLSSLYLMKDADMMIT